MGRKDTKTRQAEIVAEAIAIIGELGVRGLTTARLAGRLGMSEPNLYRHFADKRAILSAVIDEIGRVIVGKGRELSGSAKPPGAKLRMILESHVRQVQGKGGFPRLVFSEEVHVADEVIREKMAVTIASYLDVIEGVVAEGIKDGSFRSGLDARRTAHTFLGMVQFTALRWSLSGFGFSLKDEAGRLWENFYGMVRP